MRIHILTVGDEILIGQIVDTNSAWMGQQLNLMGAEIDKIITVGDTYEDMVRELDRSVEEADVVLITGGLGPTKDDITKKALAGFMGVGMAFHEPTWERIQRFFNKLGRSTTQAHKEQCFLPEGTTVLYNKMGTAPGMWFQHRNTILVSMPGVPYEMKYLMEQEVMPRIREVYPGRPIAHRTLLTVGEGESRIADRLADFEAGLPRYIKLAYLPNLGRVRLRLTARGDDQARIERELDQHLDTMQGLLSDLVYGHERQQLEEVLGITLKQLGLTLGTAESCTGGHIAHRITSISGSSAYFSGSIVAYANEVKINMLKVRTETLEEYGAVSEQTVREMVDGARKVLGVDLAVSISGIAGPGGGTPEKPVGTIWMAVGNGATTETFKLQAGKDRLKNIQYATVYALNLVRTFLRQHYPEPAVT